jgi:maleate isomerase
MPGIAAPVISRPQAVRFDQGRHPRAKLGFVLLATEQTVQEDMATLVPAGVGVHATRVAIPDDISVATLADTAAGLAEAAALLLPDGSLDVVSYACTSGSIVIGEERVRRELNRGAPGAKATSLYSGVRRALTALGARRIVVGTPYLDEINALEAETLARDGFEVLDIQGLNIREDSDMVKVAPDFLLEFARGLDRAEADTLFISCGALRSIEVIDALEAATGKPVVASNQAMAWDCLRLAGIDDRIEGYGRLLRDF